MKAARNSLLRNSSLPQYIADDIEILTLCESIGVTPSQLLAEDSTWIWKMMALMEIRAEKAKLDEMRSKSRRGI